MAKCIIVIEGQQHFRGICFKGKLYFDLLLPMGLTSSSYIAQRVFGSVTRSLFQES